MMCGIVCYIGNKNCAPVLIQGLKKLEYRGYDSAGIAYINKDNKLVQVKLPLFITELSRISGF
jgi:glucosamine--fructose-6-phosphate aminotransferase (isomerizing)